MERKNRKMSSRNGINLVIGYTPYHHMFTARFIDRLIGKTYCFYTAKDNYTKKQNREIGFKYRNKNFLGSITLALSVIYFAVFFWYLVTKRFKISVYLPHASHFLGNYLYFSKYVSDVYIYEDGILNYYDAKVGAERTGSLKKLLSFFLLMPCRPYRGHLTGFDERSASGAYLSRPKYAVGCDKIGEIKYVDCLRDDIAVRKGIILFLDQDISRLLGPNEFNRYNVMLQEFITSGDFTAYYKPHHEYNDYRTWGNCMKSIDKKLSCVPAEQVIEILRPELVISFFSSALINIKQAFPSVKCLALASDFLKISRNGRITTLSELFVEADVNVLPFDAKEIII